MFITKFSTILFGGKGSVYRLHAANGDVIAIYATRQEAEAAKAAL